MSRRITIWALAAGFAVGLLAQTPGQFPGSPDQAPQDDPADAASHGVARVSYMNGNVSIARGDAGEMAGATLNDPLVTSDRILTNGGRAELQFDAFNVLRMAEGSEVRMGDLQYRRYQVQVARGLVIFRVLRDSDAQVEISLPSASVHPLRQGIYRVLVRPDGSCEITVRAGEAEVFSPTGSERLQAGAALLSRGPANDPEFMSGSAPPFDDWDRFNSDRDRLFDRPADAGRYTAPDVYGTEDLNNHGRWVDDPSYGNVWVPNVPSDWAPYENGRWTWLDYYGWTWVSYDPWGWAPYHYGNWYRSLFGWAWYPGVYGGRHYWRPAMVGFVGWGTPGFGTSFGFGFSNIGWVPLAPREPFRPWYGHGYGRGFAGGSVISVNVNSYQNARYVNGVTGVRAGDFGRGNNFFRASSSDLAHAGALNGPVTVNRPRTSMGFNAPTSSRSSFFSAPSGTRGNNGNDGWRRMNGPSSGFNSQPRNGQAVQISPPIVNDRGANNRGEGSNQQYNGNRNGFERGNSYRDNGFGGPRPNPQGNGQPNYPQNYRSMPQQQPAQQPQMQQRAPEMRAPQMRGPIMRPERGGGGGQFNGGQSGGGPPSGGQPGGGFRGGNPGGGGGGLHGGNGGGNGGGGGHQGGGGGGHGHR